MVAVIERLKRDHIMLAANIKLLMNDSLIIPEVTDTE